VYSDAPLDWYSHTQYNWLPCSTDLNGHVSQLSVAFVAIHGGYGYEEKNLHGICIFDCCVSNNLVSLRNGKTKQ